MSQDFLGQVRWLPAVTAVSAALSPSNCPRGARVIISGPDQSRGQQAVTEIRETGGRAELVPVELGDVDSVRTLAAAATAFDGHVDVLVNNAGLFPFGPASHCLP
jgi:NAD(P)-dependent dehydrogenase (short-subunit alcohol dehydrogenase family)